MDQRLTLLGVFFAPQTAHRFCFTGPQQNTEHERPDTPTYFASIHVGVHEWPFSRFRSPSWALPPSLHVRCLLLCTGCANANTF